MVQRARLHPYALLGGLFLAALLIPVLTRSPADWENVYVPAAARLSAGEDIYRDGFVYPPINAWLPLPFVGLPRVAGRLLWFAINAVAFLTLVRGAWALAGGGVPTGRRDHLVFALGLLCGIYYVLDGFGSQQTDTIVAAVVIVGCRALSAGRSLRAALLFGLAAGVKCTPLLWAGYLAWRRRWAAAVLVPVVAIAMNVVPDLTHPPTDSAPRLQEWGRRWLLPMADHDYDLGRWATGIIHNHSVVGVANRWLTCDATWNGTRLQVAQRPQLMNLSLLKWIVAGVLAGLAGAGLACAWKGRTTRSNPSAGSMALEFGLVLILMLLASPQSSKPHFCTLLVPGFALARAALTRRDRLLGGLLLAAVVCGLVSNKDLVGARVYDSALWIGSVTWSAVLLYAGCCVALVRRPRQVIGGDAHHSPPLGRESGYSVIGSPSVATS